MIIHIPRATGPDTEAGFSRLSETNAEIAYRKTAAPLTERLLRIDGDVWTITKIEPSKFVKDFMVASLCLVS